MNYARRQQYRRLSQAGHAGLWSALVATLGIGATVAGAASLGALLLLVAMASDSAPATGFRWPAAAASVPGRRTRSGACSSRSKRRAGGFATRSCGGAGDMDRVAIAPTGSES